MESYWKKNEANCLKLKEMLQQSNPFCLYFDVKVVERNEHLVICVGSTEFSNIIGVKILNDKKAAFNLWHKIRMIISDNEATNTGRNYFMMNFYGCQMHILDAALMKLRIIINYYEICVSDGYVVW